MPRDPRLETLERLRRERTRRASGPYNGTAETPYGTVRTVSGRGDVGRTLVSLLVLFITIIIVVYAGLQYVLHGYHTAANRSSTVVVAPQEGVAQIGTTLQRDGLVINGTLFHWYVGLNGYTILPGRHRLNSNMSMGEIAKVLSSPQTSAQAAQTVQVTILPGWRAEQVALALDRVGVASYADVINEVRHGHFDYPFLADRPVGAGVEGFLLPDTYDFRVGSGARYAIGRIMANFDSKVSLATRTEAAKRYGSLYRAIILASIVEREAGTPHDLSLIASVFQNRLNDVSGSFARLDADSTIQYIVNKGPRWWGPISAADLQMKSPYNTRLNRGLPPTPIAEPSLASIEAVAHPPATGYFFFYHVPGSQGKSVFCSAVQGTQCQNTPQ